MTDANAAATTRAILFIPASDPAMIFANVPSIYRC
jgi:hypothetical protein